ncbi:MAG: hypothetical protein AB7N76_21765 [Planctomycetota bacterium]
MTSARSSSLALLCLAAALGASLGLASAEDPPAKLTQELSKHHERWLEDRALSRLATLETSREKKGAKQKRYVYKRSALDRVYQGFFAAELRKAFDKKAHEAWLDELEAKQKFMGESLVLKDPKLEAVVIHRDCASVWWTATGQALGHGFTDEAHATSRVSEDRRRNEHLTVWKREGRKWYLGLRRTPMPKWIPCNLAGDVLRAPPAGYDAKAPSATAVMQRREAVEDELEASKAGAGEQRAAYEKLDAELAEARIWDVGRLMVVGKDGPQVVLRVRVGQWEVVLQSDERHNFDFYLGLAKDTVVLFRGRYQKALKKSLVLLAEPPDGEPAVRRAPE